MGCTPVKVIDVTPEDDVLYGDKHRVFRIEQYVCSTCDDAYYDVFYKTRIGNVGIARANIDAAGQIIDINGKCVEHNPGRRTRSSPKSVR